MELIEKLIKENRKGELEKLLSNRFSRKKITHPLGGKKYAVEIAIDNKNFAILNLLGSSGAIAETRFDAASHTIKSDALNEAQKLKFLHLLHYHGANLNTSFNAKKAQSSNPNTIKRYNMLEYIIEMDYASIFSWILKVKPDKHNDYGDNPLRLSMRNNTNRVADAILSGKTPLKMPPHPNELDEKNSTDLFVHFFGHYKTNILKGLIDFDSDVLSQKFHFLRSYGYDPDKGDRQGNTMVHHLASIYLRDHSNDTGFDTLTQEVNDFLEQLRDEKLADLKKKNNRGETPSDLIRETKSIDAFKKQMVLSLLK